MRIVMLGGTGFVGRRILAIMAGRHGFVVASRDPQKARATLPPGVSTCDIEGDSLVAALTGADAVINLAGEPIVEGRWTDEKKRRIRASRVDVTNALVESIGEIEERLRPRLLINASAVGWYGDTGELTRDETSPSSADFLGHLCKDWEAAARGAETHGLRVVLVRTGIALGRGGGAIKAFETPFRAFVGAPLGPGTNFMSWVHVDDLAAMYDFALERTAVKGPINGVAPEAVRQLTFCRALARRLSRPCWPGIPRPIVRLVFGEKSDALLVSQRIVPAVAAQAGFAWRHGTLDGALDEIYG